MYNPALFLNEFQSNPAVTHQPNRYKGHIFMMNTITTAVVFLSRTLVAPLKIAVTYWLKSTNKNHSQAKLVWIPLQIHPKLFINHAMHLNKGPSASLSSLSSVPIVIPINPPPGITPNYSVPFVAMNKSVKCFDGLDNHYTREKTLHHVDAHMIFTMTKNLSIL